MTHLRTKVSNQQKLFIRQHLLKQQLLQNIAHLNYYFDRQHGWTEDIIKNQHKCSSMISDIVEQINAVAEEINIIRNTSKPDYSRINIMCDNVKEIKERMEMVQEDLSDQMKVCKEESHARHLTVKVNQFINCIQTVEQQCNNIYDVSISQRNIKELISNLTKEAHSLKNKITNLTHSQSVQESSIFNNNQDTKSKLAILTTNIDDMSQKIRKQLQYLEREVKALQEKIPGNINLESNKKLDGVTFSMLFSPEKLSNKKNDEILDTPISLANSASSPIDLTAILEATSNAKPSFPKYNPPNLTIATLPGYVEV